MSSYFQLKTKSGYDFFEVTSSFQKSVRRCDEQNGMFWAIELYKSGYANYLWERMIIMTSEDIGLAEPDLPQRIMALKSSYDLLASKKKKNTPEVLPLVHALLSVLRAKKSRYVDLAFVTYWGQHDELSKTMAVSVPDYALDMHTRRGKMKKRGLDHFYTEGDKLNNRGSVSGEDELKTLAIHYDKIAGEKNTEEDVPEQKTDKKAKPDTGVLFFDEK